MEFPNQLLNEQHEFVVVVACLEMMYSQIHSMVLTVDELQNEIWAEMKKNRIKFNSIHEKVSLDNNNNNN